MQGPHDSLSQPLARLVSLVRSLLSTSAFSALAMALFCGLASAQIPRPPFVAGPPIPPPGVVQWGDPGDTILIGENFPPQWTHGDLKDTYPNDADLFLDAAGGPDGSRDSLDATDGDDRDVMTGGPEDDFDGDPGDKVNIIVSPKYAWSGTVAQYKKNKALIRLARDFLTWFATALQSQLGTPPTAQDWHDVLLLVRDQLDLIPGPPPGTSLLVAEMFSLGPYYIGEVPPSPGELLRWFPYAGDPIVETAGLAMTHGEFQQARSDVQEILTEIASEVLNGSQASGL